MMALDRTMLTLVVAGAALVGTLRAQPAQPPVRPVARTVSGEAAGTVAPVGTPASAAASDPASAVVSPAVTPVSSPARGPGKSGGMPREITIEREVFTYDGSGRRDPYKSLMSSSDVRPLLSDLRLTAVAFDPDGNNSVAILRDNFSKQQYRIRVGQQLGRLRVAAIRQKTVHFTIEEFGFNRQETLALSSDTTKVRNP